MLAAESRPQPPNKILAQGLVAGIAAPRLSLRRLSAARALAESELFGAGDVLVSGSPSLSWRFAPGCAPASSAVVLQGQRGKICVSVSQDTLRERLGSREWWDYTGESRLLAWTLTHTLLLESLGALLQDSFQPCGWSETVPQPQPSDTIGLEFSTSGENGGAMSGLLGLPPASVSLLARHAGWQKRPALALGSWAERLRARVGVTLRKIAFPRHELLGTQVGDVLILGRRDRCWRNLELVYHAGGGELVRTWTACYDGGQIGISAVGWVECGETLMSQRMEQTNTGAEASGGALASVPVALDFEVGSLSVALGTLAGLKPGYVFQLPGRLEEARVIIRANGVRIGSGELVAVDDVLGVQVHSIDPDGLL